MTNYSRPPAIDLAATERVFTPAASGNGHWIGAPSGLLRDGKSYLAVRERSPTDRGHTLAVYERVGSDGYDEIISFTAADLGVVSLERPALITDPRSTAIQLYVPVDRGENDWAIQKLDDVTSPASFDPATARDVLTPQPGTTDAVTVKDPYIITVGGRYYMFYSGHDGESEQAHVATSLDGEAWHRSPANPILGRGFWHDHHTRVSCVIPSRDAPVWHVFYEGSGVTDPANTWNLRTGQAISIDLQTVIDTSPGGPWLSSRRDGPGRFETCRYLEVLDLGDQWELFIEVARRDGAFELRRTTVDPF